MRRTVLRKIAASALLALASSALLVAPAGAAVGTDTTAFREAVTVDGIAEHLDALQKIADANGGTRVSGSDGYDASGEYVTDTLEAAGYDVTRQEFTFPYFEELAPTTFSRTAPEPRTYGEDDFSIMEYSGSGSVTATVQEVADNIVPPGASANTSTAGCEEADFAGFTVGNIALIQRGTCTFATKAMNAEEAGAAGAIIFNEGQDGRTDAVAGTLGSPAVTIPVIGASYAVGEELVNFIRGGQAVTVALETETRSETRTTYNYIAQTPTGRTDRVVLVGAHLDSVAEGAGLNDNGSGSATVLEIAEQLADTPTTNAVRFAFWGAEESGLLGAEYYVSQLTARERKNIALNLNFDMLGSVNGVRFVYDGDGSTTGTSGPTGSGTIEGVFNDYFASQSLPTEPTAFDGRSDYGPFIAVGIPAGGLFSGAEGLKTVEEAELYGGTAGTQYDPCYHEACDDRSNVDDSPGGLLDQLADAAAHATLTFAQTTSAVNGTAKASTKAQKDTGDFDGRSLKR